MNEADNFRIEAAYQFGFQNVAPDDDCDNLTCTDAQLVAFAKVCERAGRAQAAALCRKGETGFDAAVVHEDSEHAALLMSGASGALAGLAEALDTLNTATDAELAPLLEAERRRVLAAEPCPCCGPGKHTGLPGNACENCMNTGSAHPELLT